MTITCKKCGIVDGFIEEKGAQAGLYCDKCGRWIKWLSRDEARLFEHNGIQTFNANMRAEYNRGYAVGYSEAIDDTVRAIKGLYAFTILEEEEIDEMTRQLKLKAGGRDERS